MATQDRDAIVLFAHGARDARWSHTLGLLASAIRSQLPAAATIHVGQAFLEFQSPTLEQAFAEALDRGARRIDVLPVFWASGGHIANDLPPILERVHRAHPLAEIRLLPVLSELPGMIDFIAAAVLAR